MYIIISLLYNAAVLMALCVVYEVGYLLPARYSSAKPFVNGLLASMVGLIIMILPFELAPGVIFDTRSVLIGVISIVFGSVPTLMVASIMSLYRIYLGGAGMVPGLLIILSSTMVGLLWRSFVSPYLSKHSILNVYFMAIGINLMMLVWVFVFPLDATSRSIWLLCFSIIVIFPVMTVLVSRLLFRQREHHEALSRIEDAESRYRSLFEKGRAVMLLVDPATGQIVDANEAASAYYGWPRETMRSMNITQINIMTANEIRSAMAQARDREEDYFIFRHKLANGTIADVEVYSGPIYIDGKTILYSIIHDISARIAADKELRETKSQLIQQQKLEAIGTLASGVAHEINNPINGIMNYAQLIVDTVSPDSKPFTWANAILHESNRVAGIVRSLLQFSRQEKQSHSYASPYDIVSGTVTLLHAILTKEQIDLQISLASELPDLKCRSQQIQQVLMNLLTNAKDALNDRYPEYHENKVIRLNVDCLTEDGRRWLRFEVEDRGNGIPDDLREKIFEPFFSTKPKDAGTGLGLSISFGIIKDHHGTIAVDSSEGEFTKFTVTLPVDNGWEL